MFVENSFNDEKHFRTFLDSLDSMSPQVVLDQEGRRRLTVHLSAKEYDPATGRVTFTVKQPVKQRFYYNGYFQAPRVSGILSQGQSLISSPRYLHIGQNQVGQENVWQLQYSVEIGECSDERWILPTGFECQLKFLTYAEEDSSAKWFKKLVAWSPEEAYEKKGYHKLVSV